MSNVQIPWLAAPRAKRKLTDTDHL
jgi:hypothetical protein